MKFIYNANNPTNPKTNNNNPTLTVPTVTSNTPVTGTPSLVSGMAARAEGVGVTEAKVPAVGLLLAFTLGDGEGEGEGDMEATDEAVGEGEGEGDDEGATLAEAGV